jgi:hypothetical protein
LALTDAKNKRTTVLSFFNYETLYHFFVNYTTKLLTI